MSVEPNEARLLTEIGFLAAARGDVRRAQRIFVALERIRPESAAVYVGLASAQMNHGSANDAVRTLDRGLLRVTGEDAPVLHTFRALALQLAGRGSEHVRALRQAGGFPLARAMLGEPATILEGK